MNQHFFMKETERKWYVPLHWHVICMYSIRIPIVLIFLKVYDSFVSSVEDRIPMNERSSIERPKFFSSVGEKKVSVSRFFEIHDVSTYHICGFRTMYTNKSIDFSHELIQQLELCLR